MDGVTTAPVSASQAGLAMTAAYAMELTHVQIIATVTVGAITVFVNVIMDGLVMIVV